jgi:hypothetical protein
VTDDEGTKLAGMVLGIIIAIPLLFVLCSRRADCMERKCAWGNEPRYTRSGCFCVEFAK